MQLHFDSAWTAVRALDQTWTCVQGTVQVGSGVRELLALLRSDQRWYLRLGDVTADWKEMARVDGSTTEAQLHSTAAIWISLEGGPAEIADHWAARVRWLRLLRQLPHLKRLRITACASQDTMCALDISGDWEAAALKDALQHCDLQVQSCARGPLN